MRDMAKVLTEIHLSNGQTFLMWTGSSAINQNGGVRFLPSGMFVPDCSIDEKHGQAPNTKAA